MADRVVRVAAVGDLHCSRASPDVFPRLFAQVASVADLLLLAGDLTDHGLPEEAHVLTHALSAVRIPIVAVLGNHDFESGQQDQVREVVTSAGGTVLDGEACELLLLRTYPDHPFRVVELPLGAPGAVSQRDADGDQ